MSDLRDFTDRDLLSLLVEGDKSAFNEIYFRYSAVIYQTALRFMQNEMRAADLVQEVFAKLWADRKKFEKINNLKAYLIAMSKNLALRHLKKIARVSLARSEWANSLYHQSENNTEIYLNKKGLEKLLNEAIKLLPPQQRKVYHMAKIEGLTYKAISDKLNISTVTVKKHMIAANRFVQERIRRGVE